MYTCTWRCLDKGNKYSRKRLFVVLKVEYKIHGESNTYLLAKTYDPVGHHGSMTHICTTPCCKCKLGLSQNRSLVFSTSGFILRKTARSDLTGHSEMLYPSFAMSIVFRPQTHNFVFQLHGFCAVIGSQEQTSSCLKMYARCQTSYSRGVTCTKNVYDKQGPTMVTASLLYLYKVRINVASLVIHGTTVYPLRCDTNETLQNWCPSY